MATLCWPSILIVLAFFVVVTDAEMHCLVARPRFGLVSQQCPIHTIGCRIRIERNSVSFYEFLDRNQFVCVMKGEFGDQHGSGCLRKRSGTIRCWCFGRSDCNTPENSKLLLEAFLSGDERKFHEAIQQVDFADLAEEEGEEGEFGQQQITTQLVPMNNGSEKTNYPSFDIATTETTTTTTKLKNIVTPNTTTMPSTTKTTRTFHRHNKQHHHNHQHNATAPTPSYSSITRRGSTNSTPATVGMLQSEYDRQNKVHIIHVSTRDRYEPVNIFGSETMKRIMAQESKRLKAEIADVSAEEYSDEDDEEYDEADKEAEEERAVARREMPKQKPKMAKHRMEQRERGASGSSEEQTEELKSVLGDEYFDSSFVAPASTCCYCRATALGTLLIMVIHFWPF